MQTLRFLVKNVADPYCKNPIWSIFYECKNPQKKVKKEELQAGLNQRFQQWVQQVEKNWTTVPSLKRWRGTNYRSPKVFHAEPDSSSSPPEDVPVVVERAGQSPRLRHGVQVRLQVLGGQPPAFPPNPGAAAGEQGLQGLEQRQQQTPEWVVLDWRLKLNNN